VAVRDRERSIPSISEAATEMRPYKQLEGSYFVASSVVPDGKQESVVIMRQTAYEDESVRSA
jgi:hypothetical protein